jgi:16S rRNA (guanine1207-N2)-methyltransferase
VTRAEAVYGEPPPALAAVGSDAVQVSPLVAGSTPIESLADDQIARFVVLAPPGTLERRAVLAHALRALRDGGELIVLAPKAKGGSRLAAELAGFGCQVGESARRHHRICRTQKPAHPIGLDVAIAGGAPRLADGLGLWTQPGVFSWDRVDPGSALLLDHLAELEGRGADFGCGIGVLALAALRAARISSLVCVDLDRRAVDAARCNLADPRATIRQVDVRDLAAGDVPADLKDLDFVIMNPPFHDGGREDRGLGLSFIDATAAVLRKGGRCRMVANIALAYEARLGERFKTVRMLAQSHGYRVWDAVK